MFWFLVCFYLEEMWIFVLKEASITVLLKCIYFAFSAIYWDMNGFSVIKQGLKPPISTQICPFSWWWRWRKDGDNSTRYFRLLSIIFLYKTMIFHQPDGCPTTHTENSHSYKTFLQWSPPLQFWIGLVSLPGSHPGQNQHLASNQISHVALQSSEKYRIPKRLPSQTKKQQPNTNK